MAAFAIFVVCFGLAVASVQCAASGYETAAFACAVTLSVIVFAICGWLILLAMRAARP